MTQITSHEGSKYLKTIHSPLGGSTKVDVYAVLEAFSVTCPARAHAIKKLLCTGQRGKGTTMQDLVGAEAAISRAIELEGVRDSLITFKCENPIAQGTVQLKMGIEKKEGNPVFADEIEELM